MKRGIRENSTNLTGSLAHWTVGLKARKVLGKPRWLVTLERSYPAVERGQLHSGGLKANHAKIPPHPPTLAGVHGGAEALTEIIRKLAIDLSTRRQ